MEEAEKRYEDLVKNRWEGSLLGSLRVLQNGQRVRSNTALKAANGVDVRFDVSAKLCRWYEHFELVFDVSGNVDVETLDRLTSLTDPGEATDGTSVYEGLDSEPTMKEVRVAVGQLRKGKCPGEDSITAELLKLGDESMVKWLVSFPVPYGGPRMFQTIGQVRLPSHSTMKGASDVCDNFRGIALLSVPGNVICQVIQNRLKRVEIVKRATVWFSPWYIGAVWIRCSAC